MIKSIQRLLETAVRFISRGVENLIESINRRSRQSQPVTAMIDNVQKELPAIEEMVPLPIEPPAIQVECTSCGSVGELTGICQSCRGPVCSRTFCRKDAYFEELDTRVIRCRDCAAAAVA